MRTLPALLRLQQNRGNLIHRHVANVNKAEQMSHLQRICSKFATRVNPFFRPVSFVIQIMTGLRKLRL